MPEPRDYSGELSDIARHMESLSKIDDARVRYELLSGSLVWSDELPRDVDTDCIRFVLRYRTSLILSEPCPEYEALWNEARRQFPQWIGFSPERMAPNQELAEFYARERQRLFNEMECEIDDQG